MDLEQFAQQNNVKTKRDDCGDTIVAGRFGHITDGYATLERLGVYVNHKTPKKWNNARRAAEAIGMVAKQNGDVDGVLLFDPANKPQVKLALKIAGVKNRRIASPAQLAVLAAARAKLPNQVAA
jgi:hypothetical protein